MDFQVPPSSVVVSRPSVQETSTGCAVCDGDYDYEYDLPIYYSTSGIFSMFGYILLLIVAFLIISQLIILSLIGIIVFFKKNIVKCPKCKKIFKKENKNLTHCPFCGTELYHQEQPN